MRGTGQRLGRVRAQVRGAYRDMHYGWVVVAVTFLTLLAAAGFRSTPGVLIVPLEDEFGWSRGTIGAAVSVNLILFGLAGPFAAALMERFGVRRVVSVALCLVAAGSGLTAFARAPWHLVLLWGVVVGLGTGAMAVVLAATVANRWFVARRGFVTGLLTAATATGQLIFLPLLAWLAEHPGWRWATLVTAASAAAVVPLVLFVLRDRPEDVGLRAYGAPPDHESPPPLQAPARTALRTLAMASRRRDFWLLAVPFFICGLSTNGLIATHFVPAAHDHGISEVSAASLLAAVGAFDVVGTMASGWLTDRTDPRRLLFWYYALRGASLFLLPGALATQNAGLLAFAVFYGLDWVATVPPTVALARSIFGPQAGGLVFGWVFTAHQLGAAAAAWAAGASRVWWGDYQMAFMAAGALCGVAALLSRQVGVRTPARPVTDPIPIPEPLTAPPDAGLTPA